MNASTIIIYIVVIAIAIGVNAAKTARKRSASGSSDNSGAGGAFKPLTIQKPASSSPEPERRGYTTHNSPKPAGGEKSDWSDDARMAYSASRVPEWERPAARSWFSRRSKAGDDPWDYTPERERRMK